MAPCSYPRFPDGHEDAYRTAIEVARTESLLLGPSSGAILWAARQWAKREPQRSGIGVAISPDSAFKYMSFYSDWLEGEGLPQG